MSIWEERAPSWLRSEGSPLSKSCILSFSPNYTVGYRSDVNIYLNLQFGTSSHKQTVFAFKARPNEFSALAHYELRVLVNTANNKADLVIVSAAEGCIGAYSIISMSSVFM